MNYKIRNYKKDEYAMILGWWNDCQEVAPLPEMLPEESTFILDVNDQPTICVTVYLTNSKTFCMVDNLICNPAFRDSKLRRKAVEVMNGYVDCFAKEKGFERILCMTEKNALKRRYMELGFRPTLDGVTTLIKGVQ